MANPPRPPSTPPRSTPPSTPVDPTQQQAPAPQGASIASATSAMRHVNLASGQVTQVMNQEEADWFEQTRDAYLSEAQYTEATDIRDLDRLLIHELMVFRWTKHIASGRDYDGMLIDEGDLQKNIKLYSDQITKIKESMGLTRKVRDAAANAESVSDYLTNLKARAKQFGIHREKQLDKALTLFEELSAVVGAFQRSNDEERKKIGFEDADAVLEWIAETAIPEYREIDKHFRENQQRYWVRDI